MPITTLKQAIRTIVTADAAVTAIIGTRCYNVTAPQNATLPYITFQRIDEVESRTLDGPDGLYRDRFQFDSYAGNREDVDVLGDALQAALSGYRALHDSINISSVQLATRNDLFESEARLDRDQQDYVIWWSDPP